MLKISFKKLSTKVLDNLGSRTLELVNQTADQQLITHPLTLALNTRYNEYNAVIIKKTFSGMGISIEEADLERDRLYMALKNLISGFAAFNGTPVSNAAQSLQAIFDEFGSIRGKNYAEESVIIDKLISRLSQPEVHAAIALLGITAQVSQLTQAQTTFTSLFLSQAEANSALRMQASATSIRKELEDALRNEYGFVTAMRNVAPWDALYASLSEVVKAARQSKRPIGEEEITKVINN